VAENLGRNGFTLADVNFSSLVTVVDLLYAAVIGYAFVLLGDLLSPLFQPAPHQIDWWRLTLILFILLYLISDTVEARIVTNRFPYKGRRRFSIDLFVAFAFFLSLAGAAQGSPSFLPAFSAVFALGAVWGVCLKTDTKDEVEWYYPQTVVLSHVAAAVLWFAYWLVLRQSKVSVIAGREVLWLIFCYIGWLAFTTFLKEFNRVPPFEADMFPTAVIDIAVRKTIRFFWQR
jgi:uncharacterized membrane protein